MARRFVEGYVRAARSLQQVGNAAENSRTEYRKIYQIFGPLTTSRGVREATYWPSEFQQVVSNLEPDGANYVYA
jgi:hypothetical protein